MKKSVKFIIFAVIVLAAVAGGIYYSMMPVAVRLTEVTPRTASLSFMEQGIVVAENVVSVFPTAQGSLTNLAVREGQEVRAGDILVSIDDTATRLRLEQVQSGIRGLEAQLANVAVEDAMQRQNLQSTRNSLQGELQAINAQAEQSDRALANQAEAVNEQIRVQQILVDQHEIELNRVQENFQRVESLYQSGVATRSDFEAARSTVAAAESQLEAAQGQMAVIATGVGQSAAEQFDGIRASLNAQIAGINQRLAQDTTTAARAQLEAMIAVEHANIAQLEREISNSIIVAPVDGIITTLHAQNTNFISMAAPVAEITVPGDLHIEVYVSTQDVSSIQIGDRIRLTLRQRVEDIDFYGSVVEIGNSAVVRFTSLGVEERKVRVSVVPDRMTNAPLGIGYSVDATFYVFREENRYTVPRTALFRDGGEYMVWAVRGADEGEVYAVPVQTGIELRTETIIESGLSAGDFVVNDANNQALRNGVRVRNE